MPSAISPFNGYDCFPEDLDQGLHDFDTNTFKALLSNTAPNVATNLTRADANEIAPGAGYLAGGFVVPLSRTRTGGIDTVFGTNTSFFASGGIVGPFRYVILYNATAASEPLICYFDFGSVVNLTNGDHIDLNFDSVNGLYDLKEAP